MSRELIPVPSAKVAALVIELQTIGDRFEKRGNKNWLPVARAAFILEGLRNGMTKSSALGCSSVTALIIELESIADHNEGLAAFAPVTKAASLLEGIRLGITAIAENAPPENWFGFDQATGPDMTATATIDRSASHAH